MKPTRIAVLGVYRSGSTAVAGALHHLGADMGPPFFEGFYESAGLSKQLRKWWDEPRLREQVSQPKRVRALAQWIQEREAGGARWVGMKHPLLSLCGEDLVQAWGPETRFIRCCRPLADSIDSLKRLGRSVDGEFLQGTLMAALDRFFAGREHLAVEFADLMSNPRREVERLMEYLNITADAEKIEAAIRFVEPGKRSKVEAEQGEKIGAARESGLGTMWGAIRKAVTGRGN
ncbi:MAG: sulfotransferase [Verrucomicrobiota bacterium]